MADPKATPNLDLSDAVAIPRTEGWTPVASVAQSLPVPDLCLRHGPDIVAPASRPHVEKKHLPDALSSSWPPKPSVELISRYAHRTGRGGSKAFLPWDFSELQTAVDSASAAFLEGTGHTSKPHRQGVSGTYFISRVQSSANVLGVFKPVDEELGDEALTTDIQPQTTSPASTLSGRLARTTSGFRPGEGCYKEVAAYLLDQERFAGVPQTALARCDIALGEDDTGNGASGSQPEADGAKRTRMGAFQVYQPNCGDADDFGPGVFSQEAVHRIAIFDLRVLNCDRHGGNILVVDREHSESGQSSDGQSRYDLIPIDHGFILPENVGSMGWPVWMDWPQARKPLSAAHKIYVEKMDAEMDAKIVNDELEHHIPQRSLFNMRLSGALLQKCVQAGLTLYDAGTMMYSRSPQEETTAFERMLCEAREVGNARQQRLREKDTEEDDMFQIDDLTDSPSEEEDWTECTEEYVYKYVCKLMDEHIRAVVSSRVRTTLGQRLNPTMGRVRSIPEFGTGLKPRHNTVPKAGTVAKLPRFSPSAVSEARFADR